YKQALCGRQSEPRISMSLDLTIAASSRSILRFEKLPCIRQDGFVGLPLIRPPRLLNRFVALGRDLIADIPKFFVKQMLHALMKHFNRRAHGSHHTTADDALRQFQMMKTE